MDDRLNWSSCCVVASRLPLKDFEIVEKSRQYLIDKLENMIENLSYRGTNYFYVYIHDLNNLIFVDDILLDVLDTVTKQNAFTNKLGKTNYCEDFKVFLVIDSMDFIYNMYLMTGTKPICERVLKNKFVKQIHCIKQIEHTKRLEIRYQDLIEFCMSENDQLVVINYPEMKDKLIDIFIDKFHYNYADVHQVLD